MYSADRDLRAADFLKLDAHCRPIVADWESGAIAWIAHRNAVPLLILRGVTDLVSPHSAEAQGNLAAFRNNTIIVMQKLLADLAAVARGRSGSAAPKLCLFPHPPGGPPIASVCAP